jgi:hypothetical protein
MRRAAIMLTATSLLVAGCGAGGAGHATTTTTAVKPQPPKLRVGVVGALDVGDPGIVVEHGTLARVSGNALVLVDALVAGLEQTAAAADAHPGSHFALVGASTKGSRRPNLVGLVLRDAQAARLAGVVAAFVAKDEGGPSPRVAWVGPQETKLAAAFARGVHETLPAGLVLHAWSKRIPSRCKEAALAALARGAVVVMAHDGSCAAAAAAAANQQNRVALSVADFELPDVPAALVVHDAASGVYHGGEDLVFGAASGAIGVRRLDPRISPAIALRARTAAQELASGLRPTG